VSVADHTGWAHLVWWRRVATCRLQALHGGKVLTPKSYVEMITPWTLDDGTPLRYSMGLFVGEDSRGLRQIGHDGGGFGFGAVANWSGFPEYYRQSDGTRYYGFRL